LIYCQSCTCRSDYTILHTRRIFGSKYDRGFGLYVQREASIRHSVCVSMQVSKMSGYRGVRGQHRPKSYIYKTMSSLSRREALPSDSILPEYAPYAQPKSETQPIAQPVDYTSNPCPHPTTNAYKQTHTHQTTRALHSQRTKSPLPTT
jgi:hypothetical protein